MRVGGEGWGWGLGLGLGLGVELGLGLGVGLGLGLGLGLVMPTAHPCSSSCPLSAIAASSVAHSLRSPGADLWVRNVQLTASISL